MIIGMAINYEELTPKQAEIYKEIIEKYNYLTADTIANDVPHIDDSTEDGKFAVTILKGMAKRRHTIEQYLKNYP
jgi:hypothetical protein